MRHRLLWFITAIFLGLAAAPALAQPSGGTTPPELAHFVNALYPPVEEAAGREAAVLLELTIDAEGIVTDARVVDSAGAAFDEAALTAAKQFRFKPATVDGVPSAVRIQYRYQFSLEKQVVEVKSGVLAGVVRDAATGAPLSGVTITVDGAPIASTTDEAGAFEIADIPPGEHTVMLEAEGLTPIVIVESIAKGERLLVTYRVERPEPDVETPTDDLEIVVVAPRVRREAVATALKSEQAERVPGTGGDVVRVVESLPGVSRGALGSGQLIVWGSGPDDTRVYLDGVPLPRLYHVGGIRSVIHPFFVERVTLIPGAYGAPYGRGLGGVILVDTKAPEREGLHGMIGADAFDGSAGLGYRTQGGHYVAAAGRYGYIDRLVAAVDDDAAEFAPVPRYWDLQVRGGLALSEGETIELAGMTSHDRLTRGVPNPDPSLETQDERRVAFHRLSMSYRNVDADGHLTNVVPWFGFDKTARSLRFGAVEASDSSDVVRAGLRAAHRHRVLDWLDLEAGIDAELGFGKHTRNGSLALPAREGDIRAFGQPPVDGVATDRFKTAQLGLAPFVEASSHFLKDAFRVTAGLRADPNALSVSRKTPVDGNTPEVGLFRQDFAVEPRLLVEGEPISWLTLRAAGGWYHQPPNALDLSAGLGTPDLPPAKGWQALAGAAVRPVEGLSLEATAFGTMSESLATRSAAESPLQSRALEPTGEGRVLGLQSLLRLEPLHGFFGWLTYTLSRAERRNDASLPWRLSDYDQTHVFTGVAGYRATFGLELSSRARFATGNPRTPVVGAHYDATRDRYQPLFGEQNSVRLGDFFQLDLRVAQSFELGDTELTIYLDVQNVTNQDNAEELAFAPDYTRAAAITGLPIFVSPGATWKF